jgi:hypothetical protein
MILLEIALKSRFRNYYFKQTLPLVVSVATSFSVGVYDFTQEGITGAVVMLIVGLLISLTGTVMAYPFCFEHWRLCRGHTTGDATTDGIQIRFLQDGDTTERPLAECKWWVDRADRSWYAIGLDESGDVVHIRCGSVILLVTHKADDYGKWNDVLHRAAPAKIARPATCAEMAITAFLMSVFVSVIVRWQGGTGMAQAFSGAVAWGVGLGCGQFLSMLWQTKEREGD